MGDCLQSKVRGTSADASKLDEPLQGKRGLRVSHWFASSYTPRMGERAWARAFSPVRARRLDDGQPLDARVGLVDELDVAVVAGVPGCQRGGRIARLRRRVPHTSGIDARLLVRVGEAQRRLVPRVRVNVEVGHGKLAGRRGAAGS